MTGSDTTPSHRRIRLAARALLLPALVLISGEAMSRQPECSAKKIGDLSMPCTKPLADYERELYTWINYRKYTEPKYTELGWKRDKGVRDTGPFIDGVYYGVHPAVRIYYSGEVIEWLEGGREGDLPPGSMMIKEMFSPPAARYTQAEFERDREASSLDPSMTYDRWLDSKIGSWTIMIKDPQTHDGWFWSGPVAIAKEGKSKKQVAHEISQQLDNDEFPFEPRASDFDLAGCLRCHAVAESESTFAALRNVEGYSGEPLRYQVDNSWRNDLTRWQLPSGGSSADQLQAAAYLGFHKLALPSMPPDFGMPPKHPAPSPEFQKYFGDLPSKPHEVKRFSLPGQWADHVTARPDGSKEYLTSDNCMACHGGLAGSPYAISMFLKTGPKYGEGFNISPYGEWRWSPMGLAGRDPLFHAQLETEVEIIKTYDFERLREHEGKSKRQAERVTEKLAEALVDTCLSCHGAMGQRQLLADHKKDPSLDSNMKQDYFYLHTALTEDEKKQRDYRYHKYGNLAREGISCQVCHQIDKTPPDPQHPEYTELENFLMHSTTGQFTSTSPDVITGPFDDVRVKPMEFALDLTPEKNDFIQDSKMCGTCHTINLPNVDAKETEYPKLDEAAKNAAKRIEEEYGVDYASLLAKFPHSIEQATFLEWENSDFAKPGTAQSCQDCHMPNSFHNLGDNTVENERIDVDPIISQIATIEDSTYPEVDHRLPDAETEVPLRDDYRRHELVGLNVFLLELVNQFDDILGVREQDFMTSATTGNALAMENMLRQAQRETVKLEVGGVSLDESGKLLTDVTVTNLVGHRFPSGVSFRRSWIELLVTDSSQNDKVVWASGQTNSIGLITDTAGEVLDTEFLKGGEYQPHFGRAKDCTSAERRDCPETCGDTVAITKDTQVQIYEELVQNAKREFTTSFIHRDYHVKDNRLLPRGWIAGDMFSGEILQQFMKSTDPVCVPGDPDYASVPGMHFAGKDTVHYRIDLPDGVDPGNVTITATMYFQAVTPFWLREKFTTAPDGSATRRLYYMTSRLKTDGDSPIKDWKLKLVSSRSARVSGQ